MTTQELIEYYSNLLILQYHDKQKAIDTVEALVDPVIMDQLPLAVENGFNLDTAIGAQLDSIGKYAGVTRTGAGFQGNVITLIDDDFRILIKIAIIKNASGSSLYDIQNLLFIFFPGGEITVNDYQNMRLSYMIDSSFVDDDLAQLFVTEGLLPFPMAVGHSTVIHTTPINQFFGFRTYDGIGVHVNPFNNYDTYVTTWPWLNYDDSV